MDMIKALDSINETKVDLIRTSDSPDQAEKLYPAFPVNRALSYQMDCILLVNELNQRSQYVTNQMAYDFLLNVIDKKKRWGVKWGKVEKNDAVEAIMKVFTYSREKALEVIPILSPEDLSKIVDAASGGGRQS